jgi:integrase
VPWRRAPRRRRRDEVKRLLLDGIDPAAKRKQDKITAVISANNTFGEIAHEFLSNKEESSTMSKNRWLLEDLASPLATQPISQITAAEILVLLKRIEKSGRRETARRLRGVIGGVFRYAIVTLRATSDPTIATHGALFTPKVQHRAAVVDEKQLGALMRSIDEYDGWPTLAAALKFIALTFARPGEVRGICRREINFDKAVWRIPGERTKTRRPHEVPLS